MEQTQTVMSVMPFQSQVPGNSSQVPQKVSQLVIQRRHKMMTPAAITFQPHPLTRVETQQTFARDLMRSKAKALQFARTIAPTLKRQVQWTVMRQMKAQRARKGKVPGNWSQIPQKM